jgi:hypothetical protein
MRYRADRRRAWCIAVALTLVTACASSPQALRPAPPPLAFIYFARCIFVAATIHGERALLLLDTGASRSAIDSSFAAVLGIAPTGTGIVEGTAGSIQVRQGMLRDVAIGSHRLTDLEVTIQPLDGLLKPGGKRVSGILGSDVLAQFAVSIDFSAREIVFSRSLHPGDARSGAAAGIQFQLDNGIPRLPAVLDDSVVLSLRLDTGASLFASEDVWINITTPTWRRLQLLDPSLAFAGWLGASGTGGELRLGYGRLTQLRVGKVTVPRPYVIVQPEVGYFARPDATGFLGNNFLERFGAVTIDYPGRRLILGTLTS